MFSDASSPLRGSPASERSMPGRCQRGASDALGLCGYNQPDLMLLDLGLPDAHGIDVLREIRGSGKRFDPELPVLVLSGRASEADRLRGFEAGADDYLPKPFHYSELLARVAAVLRRRKGHRSGPVRVGELIVDPVTRRVRVGSREVELANKEISRSCRRSHRSLGASSRRRSFCATSGAISRWVGSGAKACSSGRGPLTERNRPRLGAASRSPSGSSAPRWPPLRCPSSSP